MPVTATAPKLRDDLEVIHGLDDIPLIFDPVTGRYHRISRSAEVIVGQLDGSRSSDEIVALLCNGDTTRFGLVQQHLEPFLLSLESSGLLEGSTLPAQPAVTDRFRKSLLMPRYVLTRSLPVVLEPLAALLRRASGPGLAAAATVFAVLGFASGGVVFRQQPLPPIGAAVTAYVTAAIVQMLLVFVHETAHALVAQYLRTPVRGLGVALLFYLLPVAYVDRTDAYRVRGRTGRVALALAGIVSDGLMCGAVAVTAVSTQGFIHQTALALLGLQLLGLMINCNPLLPSDGYSALEAATGLVDARGRAFTMLKRSLTRKPLPAYLSTLTVWARLSYVIYGVVCAGYIGVIALGVTSTLVAVVRSIAGAYA
jgi:putative peptide zinc metalloprotease protein